MFSQDIRVALVDEQPLFRRGMRITIEKAGNVVGEYSTLDPLFDLLSRDQISVAVIDTTLFESNNLRETMQRLHALRPRFPIVLLAASVDPEQFFQALVAGIAAYEPRTLSSERLLTILEAVSKGEYVLSEDVLTLPRRQPQREMTCSQQHEEQVSNLEESTVLSPRELEILSFIACGRSNKEIAKMLLISDQTVKNHITSILKKLPVNDRTAAVVHAVRNGWIHLDALQLAS